MNSCLPTLTLDGFVKNKQMIFYKLWEYFLTSENSQSNTFQGSIASYKHIMATGFSSGDLDSIKRNVESVLNKLYKKYFDTVVVDCEVGEDLETNTYIVRISITASDTDDKTYRLAKEIENSNGEIKNYDKLLNELYEHYARTYNN